MPIAASSVKLDNYEPSSHMLSTRTKRSQLLQSQEKWDILKAENNQAPMRTKLELEIKKVASAMKPVKERLPQSITSKASTSEINTIKPIDFTLSQSTFYQSPNFASSVDLANTIRSHQQRNFFEQDEVDQFKIRLSMDLKTGKIKNTLNQQVYIENQLLQIS